MSIEDVTADYPDLESEDVRQALRYVAWLAEERVEPLDTTEGQMRTRLLPIGEE